MKWDQNTYCQDRWYFLKVHPKLAVDTYLKRERERVWNVEAWKNCLTWTEIIRTVHCNIKQYKENIRNGNNSTRHFKQPKMNWIQGSGPKHTTHIRVSTDGTNSDLKANSSLNRMLKRYLFKKTNMGHPLAHNFKTVNNETNLHRDKRIKSKLFLLTCPFITQMKEDFKYLNNCKIYSLKR